MIIYLHPGKYDIFAAFYIGKRLFIPKKYATSILYNENLHFNQISVKEFRNDQPKENNKTLEFNGNFWLLINIGYTKEKINIMSFAKYENINIRAVNYNDDIPYDKTLEFNGRVEKLLKTLNVNSMLITRFVEYE